MLLYLILVFQFQGFQLVFDQTSHVAGQDSLFSLHKALAELETAIGEQKELRRPVGIVVKMSLGRFCQKVELTYPDIHIHIYRAK